MNQSAWSVPVSDDEAHRRAGARANYNNRRKYRALMRQVEVLRLFDAYDGFIHNVQARIARELGVSRSTVCRDVKRIFHRQEPEKTLLEELAEAIAYAILDDRARRKDDVTDPVADTEVGMAENIAQWRARKGAPEHG